jgi:group I intron endonuclease
MGGKVNIYKLINIINKKIYVGKTAKSLEERKIAHIKKAEAKTNRYLYDAMNKYKYENFEITLIEEVDWFLSDEREKYWIDYYHSNDKQFGYNMTAGGGGGDTWTYTSQENKNRRSEALSKSNRGQKRSPKTIND